MIIVTDSAITGFNEHFGTRDPRPIRIFLTDGGCGGMKLSLAGDELRDGDRSHEQDNYLFLINEELSDSVGTVTIDMGDYGFSIVADHKSKGGGSCASCTCGC